MQVNSYNNKVAGSYRMEVETLLLLITWSSSFKGIPIDRRSIYGNVQIFDHLRRPWRVVLTGKTGKSHRSKHSVFETLCDQSEICVPTSFLIIFIRETLLAFPRHD